MKKSKTYIILLLVLFGLNTVSGNANNNLISSAAKGSKKGVKKALKQGANINHRDGNGNTALMLACSSKIRLGVIKLLLKKKPNVNIRNNDGRTALMLAIIEGVLEKGKFKDVNNILKNLSKQYIPAHLKPIILLFKGIHISAKHSSAIKHLLKAKARVDIQDNQGLNALMIATAFKQTGIIKKLIKAKANVHLKENMGKTALMIASTHGYSKIVKILLKAKAKIEERDRDNRTALMLATINNQVKIVKILLKNKAKYFVNDKDGSTPLILAAKHYAPKAIKPLIKAGANKEQRDKNGNTALMIASKHGKYKVVKNLLKMKANAKVKDKNGNTLLLITLKGLVETDNSRIGDLVFDGKQMRLIDEIYQKKLRKELVKHYYKTIKILIKAKTQKDTKNQGTSALTIAKAKGYTKIVKLLEKYKVN